MHVITIWLIALLPLVIAHPVHNLIAHPPKAVSSRAVSSPVSSPSPSPSPSERYGIVLDGQFAKLDSRVPRSSCPQFTTEYLRVIKTSTGHLRVPHSRILTNGASCGPMPADATDEQLLGDTYMELIPIDDLLTEEIADERGVLGAYKKLASKRPYTFRFYKFLVSERNNDPGGPPPVYVGYERYSVRKCGDVELGIESLIFIGTIKGVSVDITGLIPRLEQNTIKDDINLSPGRGFHMTFTLNGSEPEHVCPSVLRTRALLPPPAPSECFPIGMKVHSESGTIDVADVKVGDRLFDGKEFSEVVMLTHSDRTSSSTFIEIVADSFVIQASRGHFLQSTDGLIMAEDVHVGMLVYTTRGMKTVTMVGVVRGKGLFNMQTASGLVVVNGILASCYTNAVEPFFAHALLTPVRLVFAVRRFIRSCYVTSALHVRRFHAPKVRSFHSNFAQLVKPVS